MKYRKKPIEVEVMQFTDEDKNMVFNWITCNCYYFFILVMRHRVVFSGIKQVIKLIKWEG